MKWQPIETAPHNKTILAWGKYCDEPVTVRFEKNGGNSPGPDWRAVWNEQWIHDGTYYADVPPLTHWMELPTVPEL